MSERKLVIFWKHYTITRYMAGKAMAEGKKEYRVKQKSSEFPEGTSVEHAMNEIYERFGKRPENINPFKGLAYAHSFAEIVAHTIAVRPEKKTP